MAAVDKILYPFNGVRINVGVQSPWFQSVHVTEGDDGSLRVHPANFTACADDR